MTVLRVWITRLRTALRGRRAEAEFADELAFHIDMQAEHLRRQGLSPDEARRQARLRFGSEAAVREVHRETRGLPIMDELQQDVRYAARSLRRDWRFSAVAVVTLALGIGAVTSIFSLLRGVILDPLPYRDPAALVRVFTSRGNVPSFPVTPWGFTEYRRSARSVDVAVYTRQDLQLAADNRPERLRSLRISAEYFRVVGMSPSLGRAFTRAEERNDSRVVVISDRLWRDRFGADRGVIGRSTRIDAQPFTIVGVMPPDFQHVGGSYRSLPHGATVDAWWPVDLSNAKNERGSHYLNGIGRLRPGYTTSQAAGELDRIEVAAYPDVADRDRWHVRAVNLRDEIVGSAGRGLSLLMWAVGIVMLVACVNVAGLLLARGTARRRELAVRFALGANRARLIRQALTESAVLMLPGAVLGALLAVVGVRVLVAVLPPDFPRLQNVRIDLAVLAFTAILSSVAVLVFGLFPALQQASDDVRPALHEGARAGTGRQAVRARGALVAAEVALASMLLVCAGLLLRSFTAIQSSPAGFVAENVLTFQIALPTARYKEEVDRAQMIARLVDELRHTSGVVSAGAASDLPWTGYDENSSFVVVGRPAVPGEDLGGRYHVATDGFFETIRTPLIEGRLFTPDDRGTSPEVVVVNRSLVKSCLDGRGVGRVLDLWGKKRTIVGVVEDVKDTPADTAAVPAFWFPYPQMTFPLVYVTVRTTGDPAMFSNTVRQIVRGLDPELPVAELQPLTDVADAINAERRFLLVIVGLFAAAALLLAGVGAYGVLSWTVQQRSRELGIRVALGAQRAQLLTMVLGQGVRLGAVGLAAGLVAALALGRILGAALYGVTAHDPFTFGFVAVMILGVALIAALVPALQATRTSPAEAIRVD
jgi:predicted permease